MSNVYSDENYMTKMYGIGSAMIPLGFHIEYFMATDWGADNTGMT